MSTGPVITNTLTAAIQSLEEFSVSLLKDHGFSALGSLAERHGTWEIAFHKAGAMSGDLERWVVIDMTGKGVFSSVGYPSYVVEFWAGAAEPSGGFQRKYVASEDATPSELTQQRFSHALKVYLEKAIREAEAIQQSELTSRHPSPLEEATSR